MPLFTPADRAFAEAISELVYCNPFSPERIACERRALGDAFDEAAATWSLRHSDAERPNIGTLRERTASLADAARSRLAAGGPWSRDELVLYEDLALYVLYERCREPLHDAAERALAGDASPAALATLWGTFRDGFDALLRVPGVTFPTGHRPEHVFACFFQIRRAFSHIFHYLVGGSTPAARLRAAVWQSIFTHDFRRYYASLFARMGDFTTLIVGESGTGKELVARAIGRSRYVPFDAKTRRFAGDFAGSFFAVNLAALSPTLIESELFGHKKGAFTGAVADRAGWLEACPALGTVFLDEIGELEAGLQVKLLRVLQARTFSRLGETRDRAFQGKAIAATNRDLAEGVAAGRFRADFYYRLCSDIIRTPPLREQLAADPGDRRRMLVFAASRLVGDAEAEAVADEVDRHVRDHLGDAYAWPGNFRELEQCVRNVVIRGRYEPLRAPRNDDPRAALARAVAAGELTIDDLITRYTTLVYADTGSYVAAADRLGTDRRTVKARIDPAALEAFRAAPR